MTKFSVIVRGVCFGLALAASASAKPTDKGPDINPYECLGRYEAATGNRSIPQVQAELDKRLNPLFEGDEPHTVRAMKLCVVAMLESRLGNGDAAKHYAMAVAEDPEEPGYELWYGMLYSNFRGARGVVVESAEDHFYKALEKIDSLRKSGKFKEYHAVVEEWVHKRLLITYQEDGMPLLPWKASPQHGYAGHDLPGVAFSGMFSMSKDTRDFFRNNEMRLFTGELQFAQSAFRASGTLNKRQIYDIVRAPLRHREDARLRIRQNLIGAIDLTYGYEKMVQGQIQSYYQPPPVGPLVDVTTKEVGIGYERVFPLYPLFDFKLAGNVKRVDRLGVVEFLPELHEKFNLYEVRPSVSRFLGPDKITLDFVYSYLDVTDVNYGVLGERLRGKYIRAANLEYAMYRPFVLPEFHNGTLTSHRTPTRGWYFNIGVADDDDAYGTRTVRKHDYYVGTRFEGAGNWDLSLQETYFTGATTFIDPSNPNPVQQTELRSGGLRTTGIIQHRLINPDAIPGINNRVFAPDMLNIVVPLFFDKKVDGPNTYENFRVGAEIWAKFFGTGFWGPAFLTTVGYDYQYFLNIKKAEHQVHLNVRMGWGKL